MGLFNPWELVEDRFVEVNIFFVEHRLEVFHKKDLFATKSDMGIKPSLVILLLFLAFVWSNLETIEVLFDIVTVAGDIRF